MKKLIFIILFALPLFAQNYWQVIKEATIGLPAEAGFFLDENTGWIFGNYGSIVKTNDGGITWQIQQDSSLALEDINDLYFYDSNNGWACGDNGTILRTTNGGSNWSYVSSVPTSENLNGINFVSTNIGYACGKGGVILQTDNGGNSWILQNSTVTSNLNDISFSDANNGFAVFGTNSSNVLWTNSGGFLWQLKPFTKPPGQLNVRMYDCKAVRGTNHAWMIGYHGNIFHSTNKGQNWTLSKSIFGSSYGYARAIDFVDANVGFAGSDNGWLFRTTDAGASWDSVNVGTGERVYALNAINANMIIAVCENNQLRKSIDGGNTWIPIIDWPRADFRGMSIADSSNIAMSTFGGDIAFSGSAGNNFSFPNNISLPTIGAIECIEFYDASLGFYGSENGQIAKSINGGQSWYATNTTGELKKIHSIFIYNQNIAWAGGTTGKIYKTTDGGENWAEVIDLGSDTVYDLYFLSEQVGFAAMDDGYIFKCIDGNNNWTLIDSLNGERLLSMEFIDNNVGFVVGYNGLLGKTSDGGNNWDVVDTLAVINDSTFDELWDIKFVSPTEGWIGAGNAVGANGALYHTTDAGNSWQKLDSPNGKTIRCLNFSSPIKGWASGAQGTILKYDATTGIKNHNGTHPNSFHLLSNYPNPFNPTTNIEYYINISGNAELSIFNINGQKIKTIVSEYQKPGSYRYNWDGTNQSGIQVSSGTYFYNLKLENQIRAKRMILIK